MINVYPICLFKGCAMVLNLSLINVGKIFILILIIVYTNDCWNEETDLIICSHHALLYRVEFYTLLCFLDFWPVSVEK